MMHDPHAQHDLHNPHDPLAAPVSPDPWMPDGGFHQKALAFNNTTLSYIARGAPLEHLLDRIAKGFSQAYGARALAILLYDSQARCLTVGAAPTLVPAHVADIVAMPVEAPDAPRFWLQFQQLAARHGSGLAEMIPLRSFAGDVVGLLAVCANAGDGIREDVTYRQSVGAAVSMAMLAIERAQLPSHTRLPDTGGLTDERMALAIEGSGTGIWDRNAVTGEIFYSRGWKAILGYEDWELSNHIEDAYKRVHPDDVAEVQASIQRHFQARSDTYRVEHRVLCRDGSYKWICSRGKVVARDAEGNALRMIGTTTDITELKQLAEQLRRGSQLLADITDEIPGMAFQYRVPLSGQAYFTYVSEGARETYGVAPAALLEDASIIERLLHPEDLARYQASLAELAQGAMHWRMEYRIVLPDQGVRWLRGHARGRRVANGTVLWHGFISDVSESKAIELELQEFALTDYLTQVPNRRCFMQRLEQEHARLHRSGDGCAAVLMCDLDHFKHVNDTHGHGVGDMVLKHVAGVLKAELRKSDTVGRFGGEEFAVILAGADEITAIGFARRLRHSFAQTPLVLEGMPIPVTLSIGIAIMLPGCPGPDSALRRSDGAMYRAKQGGRDRFEVALA